MIELATQSTRHVNFMLSLMNYCSKLVVVFLFITTKSIVLEKVKKKMKSVGVFLLVLVSMELMCCEGCFKEERDALLALKSKISNIDLNSPWQDNTDCCLWKRVECNTTTGRVAELHLESINVGSHNWHLNYSDFRVFKDLKTLYLSDNEIVGCAKIDRGLENLEVLHLGYNYFDNATSMLSCFDGLSSLKSLSLFGSIYVGSFDVFETLSSKLPHLEVLNIGSNHNLTNEILPSLMGFTSLKELYLSDIGLDSDLHIQGLCAVLKNLEVLDISWNNFNDTDITSALTALPSLNSLNLESNEITLSSIHNISKLSSLEILELGGNNLNILWPPENDEFAWPINLQVLDLSYNRLCDNKILSSLSGLRSLKSLDISGNKLNQSLDFSDLSKLKKLENLDLSYNEFVGPLPSSFGNMTSLRTLTLDGNHFTGNIGPNLVSLTSLERLSFKRNQFEVPISFTPFANHSNLKFIHGNGNKVIFDSHSTLETWIPKFQLQELTLSSTTESNSIPIPRFLFYQHNLTFVDFTGCKLGGAFPKWLLENNTKLQELHLENCSFTGKFQWPSRPHLNIKTIDVSRNALSSLMSSSNISSTFPILVALNMSVNAIQGSIPHELSRMRSLVTLDLSDNQFSGEIPNNLTGDGHQLGVSSISRMFLSGNSLSGSIPSGFFNSSNLKELDISNNHFTGKIPSNLKHSTRLFKLKMSNNNFEGSIPLELAEHESIIYLDLSKNNLTGCIPSFANSSVKFIHLNNNHLSGLSKRMFDVNSSLVMLDLSHNELTNGIQDLMHDLHYTKLNILLIKGNNFTGNIPEQLCQLTNLSMLDLSSNSFSGAIPNCLGNMPFEGNTQLPEQSYQGVIEIFRNTFQQFEPEKAHFTSKKRYETYTGKVLPDMSGIDLSLNKLNGSIPFELGNLKRIRALNFSHNHLIGQIPATFSQLVQVESLDLSFNMLSGHIPPQLSGLHFLSSFSVAHNNLSGATPEMKGQFSTFDESSYKGNQFLCGPPLPNSCNSNRHTQDTLPNVSNTDEDNDSWMDIYAFRGSFVVAYTSVLLVLATVLYINPYWRQAWFYYIELVLMKCFYFIEDHLCKFF